MKRVLSLLCVVALAAGMLSVPAAAAETGVVLTAEGWFETIAAEITGVTKADIASVSYAGEASGTLAGDDFTYLVRDAEGGGVRIDIPGLRAGSYDLTVTTVGGVEHAAQNVQVKAYDRSGFAHGVHEDGTYQRYTQGVGAYNDDGTLKENALVLYVTNDNKNTVTLTAHKGDGTAVTATGIGNILHRNNNGSKNGQVQKYLALNDKRPLVVRFVGNVTAPAEGLTSFAMGKTNGSMAQMMSAANVTLEGIGPDAGLDGWGIGFLADNGDKELGLARNFEVRNLSFRNVPEDCISLEGREDEAHRLTDTVEHAWVHNCAFYVPTISNPAEADKAQGDGAVDTKCSRYVTMSYNYFERYHKTSLIGGGDEQLQYHITWHHNHFNGCDQRGPLGRQANMHIYNNLYQDQKVGGASYCMSLRAKVYIFSEYNSFLNCQDPVKDEGSLGVCKSFGDLYDSSCTWTKGSNPAAEASDRDVVVDSQNPYASFELKPELSYIPEGDYLLEENTDDAQAMVRAYAGVMKPLEQITHPEVHHHAWSGWTVTKERSCTEGGSRWHICTAEGCPLNGEREVQETVPLGHLWGEWTTLKTATCLQDGRREHTCQRCDAGAVQETVFALEHSYENGNCIRCGRTDSAARYVLDLAQVYAAGGGSTGNLSLTKAIPVGEDFTFTVLPGGALEPNGKSFTDQFRSTHRINPGGAASTSGNAVKFTTEGAAAVTVWWGEAGDNNRQMVLLNDKGAAVASTSGTHAKNSLYVDTLQVNEAGTYYLGGQGGKNHVYKVEVAMDAANRDQGALGDALDWEVRADGRLDVLGTVPDGETVLAAYWNQQGRFAGVRVLTGFHPGMELDESWGKVKLFRLDSLQVPQCQSVEAWKK